MNQPLLLDTCALLWLVHGERLKPEAREIIRLAVQYRNVFVSPISAWEIANLVEKRRLVLNREVEDWFEDAAATPGFNLLHLTAAVLIRSTTLPDVPHSDPADRILISTARKNSLCIVTRDRKILDYAAMGHVSALAC